jgi:demethylmenaquinone methyltransferase/2-methoxy-6-polyprenyl-1,4-benzoquinol methylase
MLAVIPALLRARPSGDAPAGGAPAGGAPPSSSTTPQSGRPPVAEQGKREYFDAIAPRWEGIVDGGRIRTRLSRELDALAIRESEHVLDLGCGTGILTSLLLTRLSARGKVSAVDFSGSMLEQARKKIHDRRVSWIAADAASMPLAGASVDRAIAFSTWPHFPDPDAVLGELRRVIRPGGALHVIHVDPRESINAIHAHAGGPIGLDRLAPAPALVSAMERCGFTPSSIVDDGERYVVSAHRDLAP